MPPSDEHLWTQLANAIALSAKQDQIVWTIFGLFCATDSVLLVALFPDGSSPQRPVGLTVALVGTSLSFVWLLIQWRAIGFLNFYDALVHSIEEHLFASATQYATSARLNRTLAAQHMAGPRVRPLLISTAALSLLGWLGCLKYFLFYSAAA